MVSTVKSSSSKEVESTLNHQTGDHSHTEHAPENVGQRVVVFSQEVDNNSFSGLQRQGSDGSIDVQKGSKLEGEQQQQQQSPTTLHLSVNSVESIDLLDMSDDEAAEEEAVVDRRAELVRQRSSRRRLGELARAFFEEDRTSSSIEPSSHRECSSRYSSDDESCSKNGSSSEVTDENCKMWNTLYRDTSEGELYAMAQAFLRGVVRLQARTRRFCAYRKFQRTVKAIQQIKLWVRPRLQRLHQKRLTIQTLPAVKLQALVRGVLARRAYRPLVNYVETQLAALIIQKWWQLVYLDPRDSKAASRIQALFRGYVTKEFFVLQRFAATLIQAQVRGQQQHRQYVQMRNGVVPNTPTLRGDGGPKRKISQRGHTRVELEASTHSDGSQESADLVDDPLDIEDEISMPPLEDMEAPSESNCASSDPSDCSSILSEVNSTSITVRIRNTSTRKRREDISESSFNESTAVKETSVSPIEDSVKMPLLTPHKAQDLPTEHSAASACSVTFTPLQPPPPTNPPPVTPRLETENEPVFKEEANQKKFPPATNTLPSEDIFPPSPAKTEVDFDDAFEDPFERGANSSSIFMILLVITCFVLPVVLFFDEIPQGFAGSKKTARRTSNLQSIVSQIMTPVSSEREQQILEQPPTQMEKPVIKMEGKVMVVAMEKRRSPPKPSTSRTVPASGDTKRPVMVKQPTPPSKRGSVVPIASIHMPSSGSIHGMVISKREKELSRALSHLNFRALGQWAKDLHWRIFERRTGPSANVEVLRWPCTSSRVGVSPMDRSKVTESVLVPPSRAEPSTKVEAMRWTQTDSRGVSRMDRSKTTSSQSVSAPPTKNKKESIPISLIHLSSFGTFHATEIGKREKAVSRRDTHLINVKAVGNWAKRIRERFFGTNAAEPTQVDVTGWLQMDGRGLFAKRLELSESRPVDWAKNAIVMKEDDVKVAKDSDLSLVTEWGLAVTTIRNKKK